MKPYNSRLKIICILFISISCIAACSNSDDSNSTNGDEIEFSIVEEGLFSDYTLVGEYEYTESPFLLKIDTEVAFQEFWNRHKAGHTDSEEKNPPSIDFNEYHIIVLLGAVETQTGYSIEIDKLIDSGEQITVKGIKTIYNGSTCSGDDSLTQPFFIVKTEYPSKEFILSLSETTETCD